jgi:hypothetical protein
VRKFVRAVPAPSPSRKVAAILLPILAVAGYLYFRLSTVVPFEGISLCILRNLTGFYCATCGATRATFELIHGNLAGAFALNPLFLIMIPFTAYFLLAGYLRLLPISFQLPLPGLRGGLILVAILIAVLILFTVVRNLPWPAFSWLAP